MRPTESYHAGSRGGDAARGCGCRGSGPHSWPRQRRVVTLPAATGAHRDRVSAHGCAAVERAAWPKLDQAGQACGRRVPDGAGRARPGDLLGLTCAGRSMRATVTGAPRRISRHWSNMQLEVMRIEARSRLAKSATGRLDGLPREWSVAILEHIPGRLTGRPLRLESSPTCHSEALRRSPPASTRGGLAHVRF